MRCRAPPTAGTSQGCPSWCLEQQCRTPWCPLHDLHAGAMCAWHRVCMGRRCPTLLVLARCAGGGRGGWGSLLPAACGAAPFGAEAPTPTSRAACTSAASCGGKGEGKGGGGSWCLPHRAAYPPSPPFSRSARLGWGGAGRCPGRRHRARYRGKKSLIGRAAPGSAIKGSAATGGARAGGKEGGRCSCPPGPINPEPLRLSARTGCPPPPPVGVPAGSHGGGERCSAPKVGYFAPGHTVPVGWESGSPAAGGGPLPSSPAPHKGAWLRAVVAPTTPAGPLTRPLSRPLPRGVPRDPAHSSVPPPVAPASNARTAASGGRGTRGTVPASRPLPVLGAAGPFPVPSSTVRARSRTGAPGPHLPGAGASIPQGSSPCGRLLGSAAGASRAPSNAAGAAAWTGKQTLAAPYAHEHRRGAHPPEVSLQQGPVGEQGLQQVDRLPQHARPLPRRQHLPGVAMARPHRKRPVAVGLKVQGQLGVSEVA